MTKTAKAPATKAAKAAKAPVEMRGCACGCGAQVERTFKQGHDQRLIANLASDIVYADVWDGSCAGILKGASVRADIQERINKVHAYVTDKLSPALADKFAKAANRAWELEKTRDQRAAAKAERTKIAEEKKKATAAKREAAKKAKAEKAPQPSGRPVGQVVTPTATNDDVDAAEAAADAGATKKGDTVRIKSGKRTRTATVHGMNQAGKITAVRFMNAGKEIVKTEGQFEIVVAS